MACRLEFGEQVLEFPPDQASGLGAEEMRRRRVDVDDARGAGIENEDGFGGELEKQAIALLRVADPRVLALHLLLRFDKALLESRHRPQIAPHDENPAIVAEADRAVADRHVRALARVVDLPPACRGAPAGIAQEFVDLDARFIRDGVDETAPDPFGRSLLREVRVGKRGVENKARSVDHQRDIGCGGEQGADVFGVEPAKKFS